MSKHSVFDERGKLILQTASEIVAFGTALRRQTAHDSRLTTMLYDDSYEIVFVPNTPGFKRAPSAVEAAARSGVLEDGS